MDFDELGKLGREADAIILRRPCLAGEQQKLDERRARIEGLLQELKDDQRHLDDRRKDGERRLKDIRREISKGRKAFARTQKEDAREFAGLAKDIESELDRTDSEDE